MLTVEHTPYGSELISTAVQNTAEAAQIIPVSLHNPAIFSICTVHKQWCGCVVLSPYAPFFPLSRHLADRS